MTYHFIDLIATKRDTSIDEYVFFITEIIEILKVVTT